VAIELGLKVLKALFRQYEVELGFAVSREFENGLN